MKEVLSESGVVRVMASEEDDRPIEVPLRLGSSRGCHEGGGFAVVFDPLDGSRNIEVSIPTGGSGLPRHQWQADWTEMPPGLSSRLIQPGMLSLLRPDRDTCFSIPLSGTIFGVYGCTGTTPLQDVLQAGTQLLVCVCDGDLLLPKSALPFYPLEMR